MFLLFIKDYYEIGYCTSSLKAVFPSFEQCIDNYKRFNNELYYSELEENCMEAEDFKKLKEPLVEILDVSTMEIYYIEYETGLTVSVQEIKEFDLGDNQIGIYFKKVEGWNIGIKS